MRALDSDGNPVQGAQPGINHGGFGAGKSILTTDEDGYMKIQNTYFTGVELSGRVKTAMTIPSEGAGSTKFQENFFFDSPKTLVFQVGEGVSVRDSSESNDTPTMASTPADDAGSSTSSTTPTTTSTASPTSQATPQPTESAHSTSFTEEKGSGPATQTNTRPPRGFIVNGGENDLEFLSNPVTLTVGGFVLSVAGIAHQMMRGA